MTLDHSNKTEILEINRGSTGSNEAHQTILELDWINIELVDDPGYLFFTS